MVVYPRNDWTTYTLTWEDHAFALLPLSLGQETVLRLFGDATSTGPAVAEALTPLLATELRAECIWREQWPPPGVVDPPAVSLVIPGEDDAATRASTVPDLPAHWPRWAQTFAQLYPKYLTGEMTMDQIAQIIRERHPDFTGDGEYLLKWRYSQVRKDPALAERLFPVKHPDRAKAIRQARRQYPKMRH